MIAIRENNIINTLELRKKMNLSEVPQGDPQKYGSRIVAYQNEDVKELRGLRSIIYRTVIEQRNGASRKRKINRQFSEAFH